MWQMSFYDITSILNISSWGINSPVPSVCVKDFMPVNKRTMHRPVSQPPPENCCCHKPYKHQMPTLKKAAWHSVQWTRNNSPNASTEKAKSHTLLLEYNKHIYTHTEENLAKLSTKNLTVYSTAYVISFKCYIIFGLTRLVWPFRPKESKCFDLLMNMFS